MIGTIVNAAGIAAGGFLGLVFKKFIRDSWTGTINKALGLSVVVIGLNGVVSNMISVTDGRLSSSGELLLVVSLIIGSLAGEILRLDDHLESFSKRVESRFSASGFAASFMNASVLFCVGAMAIIGSIQEGLTGDPSILYVKAVLDTVSAVIFGATLGMGVIFSSVPVFVYQGLITISAGLLGSLLQGELLAQVCAVGYTIIIAIGLNFLVSDRIKTLNMLPAVLVPVIWHYISMLIS